MKENRPSVRIIDLVPQDWFCNENSSVWLRIYTTLPKDINNLFGEAKESHLDYTIDKQNIRIVPIYLLEELSLQSMTNPMIYANLEDSPAWTIHTELTNIKLPKSCYIFFLTPLNEIEDNISKHGIISKINILESLICSNLGNNFLHTIVYNGQLQLDGSKHSGYSDIIQTPNNCNGPFLSKNKWNNASEVIKTIENLSNDDEKERIFLSLEYYQKGKNIFRSEEKFFFYWTAITIVTKDATTKAIRNKLQNIYNKNSSYIENDLSWMWAVNQRNDFFKRGKIFSFHYNIERYFQNLFLDLLRDQLNLIPHNNLLNYIQEYPSWKE